MAPVLCLDIGGTHTRIGLYEGDERMFYEKTHSAFLLDNNFDRIVSILGNRRLGSRAVVAFPSLIAPEANVVEDKGLRFDRAAFARRFHLDRVDLLNDLEAGAYHIERDLDDLFGPEDTRRNSLELASGTPARGQGVLIVYAGTGLGTSAIIRGHVVASEINRFLWSPQDHAERAFAEWLAENDRFPESDQHLTYNVVCSGFTIPAYYEFRSGEKREAAQISDRIAYDHFALETFEFFFAQLARYASFCTQAFLTYEGVVLGGNILRSNRDVLVKSSFVSEFRKYAFRDRIAQVPIVLDLEHDINLQGCARYAIRYP